MIISAFTVKDFKGIRDIELEPGARTLLVLEGKNGAGKSSALDALSYGIGGPRAMRDLSEPVRRGAKQAEITLRLSGADEVLTVRRRIKPDGVQTLKINAADGRNMDSPQALLDRLVGQAFIDAMEFFKAKPDKQREMLLRAVGLGDALDRLDDERRNIYDERTGVNRSLRDAKGELEGLPAAGPVVEAVDVAELHRRKAEADAAVREHAHRLNRLEALPGEIQHLANEDARLTAEIARLTALRDEGRERSRALATEQATLQGQVEAFQAPNTWALDEQLATADARNRKAAEQAALAKQREAAAARVERFQAESDRLTAQIAGIDERKAAALAAVQMPLPGLTIDEGGVIRLDGTPLSQINDAARLRLSVAIAAALRGELRTIWIGSGQDLDEDGWAALTSYAEEHGLQIIIERVGVGRADAVVIEEGRVVSHG